MSQDPLVPTFVLRGHSSAIHALEFFASNTFLASGDTDGWLVIWRLSSKRPVAVWKAHEGGVMQIKQWTGQRLITHGRDHKLRVWQVRNEDFEVLSTKLPSESPSAAQTQHPQPWLLHSLDVNALNFCAFSVCDQYPEQAPASPMNPTPQLLASPNGLDSGGIDIFQLPSERRVSQLRSDPAVDTGMVMSVALFHSLELQEELVLVSGYEDGQVMVHTCCGAFDHKSQGWVKVLMGKPHSQPVLSLDVFPSKRHFVTSSADAIIAKFSLDPNETRLESSQNAEKAINTKHAGQQGLNVRSDGKIFATAGWDGRIRVYSCKTMKELAVLKWHKDGCYATSFAKILIHNQNDGSGEEVHGEGTKIATRMSALDHIKQERENKARSLHWLAAGGKDAKITLWEVY
ncbi:uncharacterized protein A1O9_09989 [Exophiala aquamarina CBS 119918]|uniref:ASTRA-associated protein 1 n=1 Tax=Exophiala aquamarina CBS 119918 TaxID=1182545 RepID=A0A072P237_9EURO|nr:uncharacterized protein A1O9_09989 [Exophiala aquamarina CBS 119918]KEF54194.1 hypothetical protein A1O9_09989 [Exophiala aquamarina CBS 119918]